LQLFPEYDASPFNVSKKQSSDNSEYKVIFTSDKHRITWSFDAGSYIFDVKANSSACLNSVFILSTEPADTEQHYSAVVIRNNRVKEFEEKYSGNAISDTQYWVGIRDHFWTFILRPAVMIHNINREDNLIRMYRADSLPAPAASFTVYAGPITMKTLREAGKECTFLLYPMWFWMRWLSMALLYLFNMILYLNGNPVLSIVLLSLCVKIIIAPLYRVAVHWQNEVNRQRSILEPRLLEIKKLYKGEEQTNMTLSVYKEMGISPLYALKSLLSAAIQIPVFFAAYHMLSEHIALSGVSFLWISDLALPDRLIQLPFAIPFFGDYLNMLPFVMTSVSLISSFIHTDKSLSEKLHKKQQRSLFLMAAIFFFLLYASPAGMLLYWTMNNILSLLESLYTANKHKITGV
jgi:YidC/Oxa1 family membrane protein insertase